MSNVWEQGITLGSKWIENSDKVKLQDINLQNWISNIKENSKCLNYRIFKNDLIFEKYLSSLDPLHYFALCKFRCANAKLPAHTSRFNSGSTTIQRHLLVPFVT
jgi:hypothetical protein